MTGLGRRARRFVFAAWLVVVWVVLWGDLTLANVAGGVAVAVFLLAVVPRPGNSEMTPEQVDDHPVVHPIAAVSLLLWFSWKLITANLKVARVALQPPGRTGVRTAIVAVPLPGCPPGIVTLVANIITLTPGTLTMEVEPGSPVVYLHELTFTTRDAVRDEVYEIERRVVAAVGSNRARRASAERLAAAASGPAARQGEHR